MTKKINLFANLKSDFASGLVVFLVALPLCLGIALASGAPPLSGIIAGIVGGIVVGFLSNSHISVSGPAAGLTAIVAAAIISFGSFEMFLTAVLIAGAIQLALGFLKAGAISNYIPNNVIEGMLAGIGVIIILKEIPHALGLDNDYFGNLSFIQSDGQNTFSELFQIGNYMHFGALIIALISLAIIITWDKVGFLRNLRVLPAALIAVIVSVLLNEYFIASGSSLAISSEHLVSLPVVQSASEFAGLITTPDFSALASTEVWIIGVTIALVASIETLLCIEAADRMDKQKRYTDTNRELKAQGVGNMVSALIGGLPMTSVVVRTSANNNAGAKSKMSTIIHGGFLLVSVAAIPFLLNKIPYATLAAVLFVVGYKLAKPATFVHFYKRGKYQFVPFLATFVAVVVTDLLKGVLLGLTISIIFVLRGNLKRAYHFRKEEYVSGDIIHIDLAQEVSFLNKAAIKATLSRIPEGAIVIINAADTVYISHDVLDMIREFKDIRAVDENIEVKLIGFKKAYDLENTEESGNHVVVEHVYDARKRATVKKEPELQEL
jgi:MFS superfamily sulfate permease-like transporter